MRMEKNAAAIVTDINCNNNLKTLPSCASSIRSVLSDSGPVYRTIFVIAATRISGLKGFTSHPLAPDFLAISVWSAAPSVVNMITGVTEVAWFFCKFSSNCVPVITGIFKSLRIRFTSSSFYGKALSYASKELALIERYLEDGQIELDNNLIENPIAHSLSAKKTGSSPKRKSELKPVPSFTPCYAQHSLMD